jgi:hypothetical protein
MMNPKDYMNYRDDEDDDIIVEEQVDDEDEQVVEEVRLVKAWKFH